MEAVFGWVATYGYGALFGLLILGIVGLPIPDETLLVFCGYLISRGDLGAPGTYIAALAGSCCGITVSYFIGRTAGLAVVHRFGRYLRIEQKQLDRVHGWFDHSGHWALFGGYYIAGVRHLTAIIAGASKLEFRTFALYAWGGAATWVAAFLIFSPLLSPQFLLWLVPFAAIVAARGDWAIGRLTTVVVALSVLDLNVIQELVHTNSWWPQAIVLGRNVLLVILVGKCLAALVRGARRPALDLAPPATVEAAA